MSQQPTINPSQNKFLSKCIQIKARRTTNEMKKGEALKQKAQEMAEKMMKDKNFSFQTFIKERGVAIHYRKLEKLTKREIKEAMEQQLFLELLKTEREKEKANGA